MATDTVRAESQARAQLAGILELVKALDTNNDDEKEEAQEAIQESPLNVEVRSGWHTLGAPGEDAEYCILLCTGGPAVRIVGTLSQYNGPEDAHLECQDWFTPWVPVPVNSEEQAALLAYAREFYFDG